MKHSYNVTIHISKIRDPTVHQTVTRIVWADALTDITRPLVDSISAFPTTRRASKPLNKKDPSTCLPTKSPSKS